MDVTTTILVGVAVFAVAMLLMAVGVIFSNRRIRGSCGGLANMRDENGRVMCDACTSPSEDCAGPDDQRSESAEQQRERLRSGRS